MILGSNFDNIQEQILTEANVPAFDDEFNRLLHHSSNAIGSSRYKPTSNSTCSFLSSRCYPLGPILVGGVGTVVIEVPIINAHIVTD